MRVEVFDPGLERIIAADAVVETLASGGDLGVVPAGVGDYGASLESPLWWHEGGYLLVSDVARGHILRWDPREGLSVFLEDSGHANGLWRDPQGRLLLCEHAGRQVSRLEPDGTKTVVMRSYRGQRLNRPNTVVATSDGSIWFTDFKFRTGPTEDWDVDFEGVYHVSADLGTKTLVLGDLHRPHKLLFSADEKTLFIGQDEGILAFDLINPLFSYDAATGAPGRRVSVTSRRWFWRGGEHGAPMADGIKLDVEGNVYIGGKNGIWFIAATGELLGRIDCDGLSTPNLAFGGDDWSTLYFVANHALYRVPVAIPGLPIPSTARQSA